MSFQGGLAKVRLRIQNRATRISKGFFTSALRTGRSALRRIQLGVFVAVFPFLRRFSKKKWLFNLDCHVSVISDIKQGLKRHTGVKLVSWSLSKHNFVFRSFFVDPDPVFAVDSDQWSDLSNERIALFLERYSKFLSAFDGFIVTYPVAFARLYTHFNKPVMVVAAIRYEHPYSRDISGWGELDKDLKSLASASNLLFVANNRGDADYASHFLGFDVETVPSLCDYIRIPESEGPTFRVVQCRSAQLETHIAEKLGGTWVSARQHFGKRYSWASLSSVEAVFYVPYNTSTMTLFEFATLGMPVFVPSKSLSLELARGFKGVFSEISFRDPSEELVHPQEPGFLGADYTSKGYLDWWLDRADFSDPLLMPNVRIVNSLADKALSAPTGKVFSLLPQETVKRNAALSEKRFEFLDRFVRKL